MEQNCKRQEPEDIFYILLHDIYCHRNNSENSSTCKYGRQRLVLDNFHPRRDLASDVAVRNQTAKLLDYRNHNIVSMDNIFARSTTLLKKRPPCFTAEYVLSLQFGLWSAFDCLQKLIFQPHFGQKIPLFCLYFPYVMDILW